MNVSSQAARMMSPVTQPPKVVLAPLAALTALRPREATTGMEPTKEPTRLHVPRANISWQACTR